MVDDVMIDGGDGWWLECSKSITRENREGLPPPPQKKINLFLFFVYFFEFFWSIYSFGFFLNALFSIG